MGQVQIASELVSEPDSAQLSSTTGTALQKDGLGLGCSAGPAMIASLQSSLPLCFPVSP